MAEAGANIIVRLDGVESISAPSARLTVWISPSMRGECVGLVGHNGAGKSTLMHVLAGTLTPDSGAIAIGGASQSGYSVVARPGPRHPLRVPGTVALPQPHGCGERAHQSRRAQGPGLAPPRRRSHPRQARRDLSRPRHRGGRHRPRPLDRQAPDGRGGARLHGHRRPAASRHPGRADLVARLPTPPASCCRSSAASSPAAPAAS